MSTQGDNLGFYCEIDEFQKLQKLSVISIMQKYFNGLQNGVALTIIPNDGKVEKADQYCEMSTFRLVQR